MFSSAHRNVTSASRSASLSSTRSFWSDRRLACLACCIGFCVGSSKSEGTEKRNTSFLPCHSEQREESLTRSFSHSPYVCVTFESVGGTSLRQGRKTAQTGSRGCCRL